MPQLNPIGTAILAPAGEARSPPKCYPRRRMTTASSRPGTGQTALVTGASSGIGLELARLFAKDGYDLVLVARSRDRLKAVARGLQRAHGISAYTVAIDLAEPGAAPRLHRVLRQEGLRIDVLANNAGYGTWGPFDRTDPDALLGVVQVNAAALVHLTRLFLPAMLERRRGRILNVASLAAFQPGPLMAVYYATKAFVLSFSEALIEELRGSGVTVTVLCPGPTRTRFGIRAKMTGSRLFSGKVIPVMAARPVAAAGYRGLLRGKPIVIPGARNRLFPQVVRLVPRAAVRRIVRMIQDRR